LILRKINKIGATKCLILRLKCTKFDFRWGSLQTPLGELTAGRAYSAPPHPLAVFKGPACKGSEGKGREREGKGEGRDKEGKVAPSNWGL